MSTEQDKNFDAFTFATTLLPCLLTCRRLLKDAGNCQILLRGMCLLQLWTACKLLQAFFKIDTTDSLNIGSLRCQPSEEQMYQSSLCGLTAELDLAFFAQPFEITNLHVEAKMDQVLFLAITQ